MKHLLKRAARKLRSRLRRALGTPLFKKSYSQQGEDMILDCFFQTKVTGFYVDVGAHHPVRLSNTCHLHKRGWRGINIDATPGSMTAFRQQRRGDINLECGVSGQRQTLTLHAFDEPALNGFSEDLSSQRESQGQGRQVAVHQVEARPLRELLAEHLPAGQHIDVLNVDVEGFDLEVLRSNDWTKYRPTIVIAEEFSSFLINDLFSGSALVVLMRGFGYTACAKSMHSVFFVADEQVRIDSSHHVHLGPAAGTAEAV